MTEPLAVDPPRLKAAGNTLRGLVFPTPPAPIVASGTDAVSAAINATLPAIESPVIEGLPAVKAAVTRNGSNIVTAANMYAETDQRLGDHVGSVQFRAAGDGPASGASANQLMGAAEDKPGDGEAPASPQPTPQPAQPVFDQIPTQLGQVAALAGSMAPVTQNLQTVMSTVQGAAGNVGSAGSPSTQLAGETTKSDAEEEQRPESLPDGAAPGEQATGSVPVEPPSAPEATPSALEV
jgi:hypothetical protein